LITTTLTTVLAFGAYLVAEQFHVSGVLAIVAAGLVSGNIGPRGMSPSTRILVYNFWEIAAFIANSFVFLLIGLQIDLFVLALDWYVILWALLAVLVARAIVVYGLSWIGPGMPGRFKHVLFWGGLRGAISLALALSLPDTLGIAGDEIQTMAFGVVLFTLLVQGLSMPPLIRKMKLVQRSETQIEYEQRHARAVMTRSAYNRLDNLYQESLLSSHIWDLLAEPLQRRVTLLSEEATEALHADPNLEAEEIESVLRDLLQTQRNTLTTLLRDSIITEETYAQLVGEVDSALSFPRTNLLEFLRRRSREPVKSLLTVVIQEQDVEGAIHALEYLGVTITRLSSTGSFLGKQNVTLLIGVPEGVEDLVIQTLKENSRPRFEMPPSTPETTQQLSEKTSIIVGGATIFTFDVERFEEF
jgi:CPA1 family monovalent cation:H+ antiporter